MARHVTKTLLEVLSSDESAFEVLIKLFSYMKFARVKEQVPGKLPIERLLTTNKFVAYLASTGSTAPTLLRTHTQFFEIGCMEIADKALALEVAKGVGMSQDSFKSTFDKYGLLLTYSPRAIIIMALGSSKEVVKQLQADLGITRKRNLIKELLDRAVTYKNMKLEAGEKAKPRKGRMNSIEVLEAKTELSVTSALSKENTGIIEPMRTEQQLKLDRRKAMVTTATFPKMEPGVYVDASVLPDVPSGLTVLAAYDTESQECVIERKEGLTPVLIAEEQAIALGARSFPECEVIITDNEDAFKAWKVLNSSPPVIEADKIAFMLDLPLYPLTSGKASKIKVKHRFRNDNQVADRLSKLGRDPAKVGRWRVEIIQNGSIHLQLKPIKEQSAHQPHEQTITEKIVVAEKSVLALPMVEQLHVALEEKEKELVFRRQQIEQKYLEIEQDEALIKALQQHVDLIKPVVSIFSQVVPTLIPIEISAELQPTDTQNRS